MSRISFFIQLNAIKFYHNQNNGLDICSILYCFISDYMFIVELKNNPIFCNKITYFI